MQYPRFSVLSVASMFLLWSGTAGAATPSLGRLYVHTRVAEVAGDQDEASAGFARLIAADPDNMAIAARAYGQALTSGEMDLAVKAARALATGPSLPADARLLLILADIKARDWPRVQARMDAVARDPAFGFMAPYLRAWIAGGSGKGDALALVQGARSLPLAAPYYSEQRALILIALGRRQEGLDSLGPQAAQALPSAVPDAAHGLSPLLVHIAADLTRQRYVPVAMRMTRMATFVAPDNSAGWLVLAELLRRMDEHDLALAALGPIGAADPLADEAHILRIALLNDSGKPDAELAAALEATKRPEVGPDDWRRVGDLYMVMARPADAATAYAHALDQAQAAGAPAGALWPILLQQGGALDQAGKWPAAKAALLRAYALAPDEPAVLNQLGYSQIEHRENVDQASAMLARASSLRPDDPAITDSLGWVLYLQGKADKAVPLLERAAAGSPAESTISEHLGDAYWSTGRYREARYAWRAASITAEDKERPRLAGKIEMGLDQATAAP